MSNTSKWERLHGDDLQKVLSNMEGMRVTECETKGDELTRLVLTTHRFGRDIRLKIEMINYVTTIFQETLNKIVVFDVILDGGKSGFHGQIHQEMIEGKDEFEIEKLVKVMAARNFCPEIRIMLAHRKPNEAREWMEKHGDEYEVEIRWRTENLTIQPEQKTWKRLKTSYNDLLVLEDEKPQSENSTKELF